MVQPNFWQGETCEYCGGEIVEKRVTLTRKVKGQYVLIENVPAGICTKCGTRYFSANVLKTGRKACMDAAAQTGKLSFRYMPCNPRRLAT